MTKQGSEKRLADMNHLRFSENWSLDEIGKKYGVSRERVRQILGNTGNGFVSKRTISMITSNPGLTLTETKKAVGLSKGYISHIWGVSKQRHAMESGSIEKGTNSEIAVSCELNKLGIDHELMPHHHPFDILLSNGKRVDVKSSFKKSHPKSQRNEYYHFNLRQSRRGQYADFFILHIVPESVFLVIPADVIGRDTITIRVNYPPLRKNTKYIAYKNSFYLLK